MAMIYCCVDRSVETMGKGLDCLKMIDNQTD